ncbi:MAG: VOC family protein [Actinobacteria bacterium]|nr:VOC family protein [Actinomycetota bacterium]
MDMRIEALVLGVNDVDRAKAFYDQIGFNCDVDHKMGEDFRVVQFTPPGSDASIIFGTGIGGAKPGAVQGLYLCVDDIEDALVELKNRSVDVSEAFHFGAEGQTPGLHPERAKFGTFATFSDPDGNGWLVQEVDRRQS